MGIIYLNNEKFSIVNSLYNNLKISKIYHNNNEIFTIGKENGEYYLMLPYLGSTFRDTSWYPTIYKNKQNLISDGYSYKNDLILDLNEKPLVQLYYNSYRNQYAYYANTFNIYYNQYADNLFYMGGGSWSQYHREYNYDNSPSFKYVVEFPYGMTYRRYLTETPYMPYVVNLAYAFSSTNIPKSVKSNNLKNLCNTYTYCEDITDIYIGDNVIDATNAYYGTGNKVTKMYIGDSCVNSARQIFGFSTWKYIYLNSSDVHGYECFYYQNNLDTIEKLGNNIYNLHSFFGACTKLNTAIIPNNVNDLTATYAGCINVVNIIDNRTRDDKLLMPGCFSDCHNLENPYPIRTEANLYSTYQNCFHLLYSQYYSNVLANNYEICETYKNCRNLIKTGKFSSFAGTDESYYIYNIYYYCDNLIAPTSFPNISDNGYLGLMGCFCRDINLEYPINLSNKIISISNLYQGCSSLLYAPIGNNLISIRATFSYCPNLIKAPYVNKYSISLNCSYSYEHCNNLVYGIDIIEKDQSYFDYNLIGIYSNCHNLSIPPILAGSEYFIYCFENCSNLLESRIYNIEYDELYLRNTFASCNNLVKSFYFKNSLMTNYSYTYANCQNLIASMPLENTLNICGMYYNCTNLLYAECGSNIINMVFAYYNCSNIKEAKCGSNVINMAYAYGDCINLINANIGENVVDITNAYTNCEKLTIGVCGNNVKYMNNAYQGCTNLRIASIYPKVINANGAYQGCTNLEIIQNYAISCSLDNVFSGCTNIRVAAGSTKGLIGTNGLSVYIDSKDSLEVACARGVRNIESVYEGFPNLKVADWYGGIQYGNNAYRNCYNLEIPVPFKFFSTQVYGTFSMNNIYTNCIHLLESRISAEMFNGGSYVHFQNMYNNCTNIVKCGTLINTSLSRYVRGESTNMYSFCSNITVAPIMNFDQYAVDIFNCCNNLSYLPNFGTKTNKIDALFLRLPNIIKSYYGVNIDSAASAFCYCNNLIYPAFAGEKIKALDAAYQNCPNIVVARTGIAKGSMRYAYSNCQNLIYSDCSDYITDMSYGYYFCPNLKYASCGNNVTNMDSSYYSCTNLEKAASGINVQSMNYTYYNCRNLQNAVCGDNVKIMTNTYGYCYNIIEANIGNSVQTMSNTFYSCNNLLFFNQIPNTTTNIPECFYRCDSLVKTAMGSNVINAMNAFLYCNNIIAASCSNIIYNLSYTYANCKNLIYSACGKNVRYLNNAYRNCPNLKLATFGEVTAFMDNAYADCPNIQGDTYMPYIKTGTTINIYRCFYNRNTSNRLNIHVKPSSYSTQQGTTPWYRIKYNTAATNSITGTAITWTDGPGGTEGPSYYNTYYNIYVYNDIT